MRRLHRWIAILFGFPLLLLAVTGTVLAFRGEASDLATPGAATEVAPQGIGARIAALQAEGAAVDSVWTSGSRRDRFDIYYALDGEDRILGIDGNGNALREIADAPWVGPGFFDVIQGVHADLSLGLAGAIVIGLSGGALIALIVIGIQIGWPGPAGLRRALLPSLSGKRLRPVLGRLHRAAGLWLAVVGMFLSITGVALVAHGPIDAALGVTGVSAPEISAPANAAVDPATTPAEAMSVAFNTYPSAYMTMLSMPRDDLPWYRIRLVTDAEKPRVYGHTYIFVAAHDPAMVEVVDAQSRDWRAYISQSLYAWHTGQFLGRLGELLVVLGGLWLTALCLSGGVMVFRRR